MIADVDKDGPTVQLEFDEFLEMMKKKMLSIRKKCSEEEIEKAFNFFDDDG